MLDQRLRDLYGAAGVDEEPHVGEEVWERLACGEAGTSERAEALDHVSRCPECAEIYSTLVQFESEARERGLEVPGSGWAEPRRRYWIGLAAAAVLLLVLVLPLWYARQQGPAPEQLPLRATTAEQRPQPLEPIGEQRAAPSTFVWQGLGEGWSYRVELLDADAEPLWESAPLAEQALELPPEVAVERGVQYYWRVLAEPVGGGTASESRLVSFTVP